MSRDNVVIGLAARDVGKLFIVDFGFAEAFKNGGVHIRPREGGALIGTRELRVPPRRVEVSRAHHLFPSQQRCSCPELLPRDFSRLGESTSMTPPLSLESLLEADPFARFAATSNPSATSSSPSQVLFPGRF